MEKYRKLAEKFIDKGYIHELHWLVLPPPILVLPPPIFELSRLIGNKKEQYQTFLCSVEKVYGEDWDYWSAWIDTQLPK